MPIRPENRGRYPADWKDVRATIMARAGNRCEAYYDRAGQLQVEPPPGLSRAGELAARCAAFHHDWVLRDASRPWHVSIIVAGSEPDLAQRSFRENHPRVLPPVRVVLTIAHLDHQPENNDPANLRALCQRCHNVYDRAHRAQTRAETRRREQAGAGQGALFDP